MADDPYEVIEARWRGADRRWGETLQAIDEDPSQERVAAAYKALEALCEAEGAYFRAKLERRLDARVQVAEEADQ